jgi:hypothetical protein
MLYISHKIIVSGDKAKAGPGVIVETIGLQNVTAINRWSEVGKEMFNNSSARRFASAESTHIWSPEPIASLEPPL